MENIKSIVKNYIMWTKEEYSYPYDMEDVKELQEDMKRVFPMADKDFSLFLNTYSKKTFMDESHRFNYSLMAFESMLNGFFSTSATTWKDSKEDIFDRWYKSKSNINYCMEGPIAKEKYKDLFDELEIDTNKIVLSVYELKDPLTYNYDSKNEKDKRRWATSYTRIIFPKANDKDFPWSKVKDWFFWNFNNKLKIPEFNSTNYKLDYIDNDTGKKHNWKEIVMVDRRLKYKDLFQRFRAPGYNICFEVKVDKEFAKIESLAFSEEDYYIYDLNRHFKDQVK